MFINLDPCLKALIMTVLVVTTDHSVIVSGAAEAASQILPFLYSWTDEEGVYAIAGTTAVRHVDEDNG